MRYILIFLSYILLLMMTISASAQEKDITSDRYGACLYAEGKLSGMRINEHFAMHSIMKFPQALFVADYMNTHSVPLHNTIKVKKGDLMSNTWSPMLEMFEDERDFSYAELLELSLAQSDNNACDILFKCFGGPEDVEKFLRKHGFKDINIKYTEREMGVNPMLSSYNNCTPKDLALLFDSFIHNKERNDYFRYIWNVMASCQTGAARIASVIPEGSVFVHKTGTGFPSTDKRQDRNDAGVIVMPNGSYKVIVVFAPQSKEDSDVADIGNKLLKNKP